MVSPQIADMTRNPADLGKQRCAITLRKALAASGRFATVRQLADASTVKYDTLKKYFQGRHVPSLETWRHLATLLGQQPFTPPQRETIPDITAAGANSRASDQAAQIWKLMQQLSQCLDVFKRGTKADREALRKIIPGRDVGYLTSLLRALYDEDQFEAWILFSEYSLGGSKR